MVDRLFKSFSKRSRMNQSSFIRGNSSFTDTSSLGGVTKLKAADAGWRLTDWLIFFLLSFSTSFSAGKNFFSMKYRYPWWCAGSCRHHTWWTSAPAIIGGHVTYHQQSIIGVSVSSHIIRYNSAALFQPSWRLLHSQDPAQARLEPLVFNWKPPLETTAV